MLQIYEVLRGIKNVVGLWVTFLHSSTLLVLSAIISSKRQLVRAEFRDYVTQQFIVRASPKGKSLY